MEKTETDKTPTVISEDPDKTEENQEWLRILARERKRVGVQNRHQ